MGGGHFSLKDWDTLKSQAVTEPWKCTVLARRCTSIGLKHPTEVIEGSHALSNSELPIDWGSYSRLVTQVSRCRQAASSNG